MTAEILGAEALQRKRVLVTGCDGFIGRRLVTSLHAHGALIFATDLSCSSEPALSSKHDTISVQNGSLSDARFVNELVAWAQPEYVFHLAAAKTRDASSEAFRMAMEVNVSGTLNLVLACRETPGLKGFVAVGTAEEYGAAKPPFQEDQREAAITAYSWSKTCTTHLVQTLARVNGMPCREVRPSVAYGEGQGPEMFLASLVEACVARRPFFMSTGTQTRDFVYVDDIVEALLLAATKELPPGSVLNIGSGEPVVLKDVAALVESLTGASGCVQYGAKATRPAEILQYEVDIDRARALLGWRPKTALADGLNRMIEWTRGRGRT